MILAAGFGTRLGEITKHTPKCLIEVGGKTLLEHVVLRLKSAGVNEVVINTHYLADKVSAYLSAKGYFGIKVHITHEAQILGTGGGLKNAASYFQGEQNFIMHNADIFSEVDLAALVAAHQNSQAVATLATLDARDDKQLIFDQTGNLWDWGSNENLERSTQPYQGKVFSKGFLGIQVLTPKIFQFMNEDDGCFSVVKTYLKASRAGCRVESFDCAGAYWVDVGTPKSLAELRAKLEI